MDIEIFYWSAIDSCRSSLPGFLSSEFHESVQSETNDSEDEASSDGVVFSNLEEDDDSTHGKMPCSQYESSGVDELIEKDMKS